MTSTLSFEVENECKYFLNPDSGQLEGVQIKLHKTMLDVFI